MSTLNEPWLVRAMHKPSFYDHPVNEVTLIETHISWVFLAGDFVYKVKKPLDLGFLDFSSLARRHHFCQQELQLNRQFTPDLYLGVTPIGGTPEDPVINCEPALEYAVKMRRFPQACQLDRMLAADQLSADHISAFATLIAKLHQQATVAEATAAYGSPAAVMAPIRENFKQIRPLVQGSDRAGPLARLEQDALAALETLRPIIAQRKTNGFVRACHGDVHLANMAWFEEQPLLFDCIEFDENLRWIDVINDVAFLVMDLDDRQQSALGWGFLNRYLQETGDYPAVALLNLYKGYRAMVRAKVTCLRLAQGHFASAQEQARAETLLQSYLDLAQKYTQRHAAPLIITHGFSASGKSTFASQLACHYGAIHLRSDLERKRLYGLPATAKSDSPIDGKLYSAAAFAKTYQRLEELAEVVLHAGLPVIVDATFLKKQQREMFRQLSGQRQVPMVLLDFCCPEAELRRRIEQRQQAESVDASEANLEVLDFQLAHAEALTIDEQQAAITVNPDTSVDAVLGRLPQ